LWKLVANKNEKRKKKWKGWSYSRTLGIDLHWTSYPMQILLLVVGTQAGQWHNIVERRYHLQGTFSGTRVPMNQAHARTSGERKAGVGVGSPWMMVSASASSPTTAPDIGDGLFALEIWPNKWTSEERSVFPCSFSMQCWFIIVSS
jgi:hypothetical protein